MAAGIEAFGAYIPMYRMSLDVLAQVWGTSGKRGEKAVANWDEDSLTMAVEAGVDCLRGIDRDSVDGLYLASTTLPYKEKQTASIVAKALDLRRDIATLDVADSLRGGTQALRAALDAVNAGSARRLLVIASDCRIPYAHSPFEEQFGDGAAALLVGGSNPVVQVEGSHTISSEFMDVWRREEDRHVQSWEERFNVEQGYLPHIMEAATGLLQKTKLGPKDFAKAAYSPWDQRRHAEVARRLGFNLKTQVQDSLLSNVGNTGTAQAMMILVAALEEAKASDRIFFACYGDGADAYALRATERIGQMSDRRGIRKHLASKMMLPSYGKYLHYRNLMEWQPVREIPPYSSLPVTWRDRQWIWSLRGMKCRKCGTIQLPVKRVCNTCHAKDEFDEVRLSDRKAKLFSYSTDTLGTFNPDPPNVLTVVDFEGGGRLLTTMTDRDPGKIQTDMPVELTLRRLTESMQIKNYFWKCRPIRA
ncbi:MAG: OB-fold domain-containing protein [Chloroflexi bacterium]|nr:OB-fold domain-containing protein [Chloroflexota bacterium]